jgi:hypothetical protein
VQLDICDEGNYLTCTHCEVTERSRGFNCSINELETGCCRVLLFDLGGKGIPPGAGPLFLINYSVAEAAPTGECRSLAPEKVKMVNESGTPFASSEITSVAGRFCYASSVLPSTTTSTITSWSWQQAYGEMWGEKKGETVSVLRFFRDHVVAHSEAGRSYISLLYDHSPEMMMLLQNPLLSAATGELLTELLPAIRAVNEGTRVKLSPHTVAKSVALLQHYEMNASPQLQMIINKVRGEVEGGALFRQLKIEVE